MWCGCMEMQQSQKWCCFLWTLKCLTLTPVPSLWPQTLSWHTSRRAVAHLAWRPCAATTLSQELPLPQVSLRGEELKLFLSLQLPSKASSHSLRVGNWSERKSHRLPRLPKRHSHDDMLLLAQLGIPSSPSSLNEDSLSTASELLSTRRARRIPKVLVVSSGLCWGEVTCLREPVNF